MYFRGASQEGIFKRLDVEVTEYKMEKEKCRI